MCGIVGVVGRRASSAFLIEGLSRLEYRGYDSAGIATIVDGGIERRRASGKLANLAAELDARPLKGTTGIGHTRWATHGAPTVENAHPHTTSRVAVVHNGIIENHAALRAELEADGHHYESETDTETVAHLLDTLLARGMDPVSAVRAAVTRLEGSYALAIIFARHDGLLIGVRNGAPLATGYGDGRTFLGSDALALAPVTDRVAYLVDGDIVVITASSTRFIDASGRTVDRKETLSGLTPESGGKGGYSHFMEKELHEHPRVVGDVISRFTGEGAHTITDVLPDVDFRTVRRITLSACGSAFYAGCVGRHWFESLARIPFDVDIASEFVHRDPPLEPGGLGIVVSQSGETADTLAALRLLREDRQMTLALVNVPESTIARESDHVIATCAGPEIGVASTKAFTAQLAVLACLAVSAAKARGLLTPAREASLVEALTALPAQAAEVLSRCEASIRDMASELAVARDVLYLARGNLHPVAMEGALKLKEITYIHAEGYAAGEMKHGPIALIDRLVPIVGLAPSGHLFEKTASNLQEAQARGGRILLITDAVGAARLDGITRATVVLPVSDPFTAPILYAVAVQMLAYHTALLKGTDLDQPRNLAKSVTVL